MQSARLWARLLGVEGAVIGRVWYDEQAGAVVVAARPRKHQLGRCGVCRRRCGGFDRGEGRRRWRALDLGTFKAFVEADAPRVRCPDHGVVVMAVPWARHGARHTRAFDDTPRVAGGAHLASRPWGSCCGWRGRPLAGSSPVSPRMPSRRPTGLTGCAGSGSMRSPVRHEAP